MLYVIEASVANYFAGGGVEERDLHAIDYLTMAVAEGNHRIGGLRSTLTALANYQQFTQRARSVLSRAAQQSAQYGRLPTQLTVVGRVIAGGTSTTPTHRVVGNRREIVFPLRWFDRSAKIQPTVLLGENLYDVDVLLLIARTVLATADFGYLPLNYLRRGGGGSSTRDNLISIIEQSQKCLCVVDSDKQCPTGQIGGTAHIIQGYKDTSVYPFTGVIETSGRDLENALPLHFYRQAYGGAHRFSPFTTLLENIVAGGHHELRLHLDVENGLTLRKVFSHVAGSPERIFWDTQVPILSTILKYPANHFPCIATGVCGKLQGSPCTCVVFTGNTLNILDEFHQLHATTKEHELAAMLSDEERAEWVRLGMEVISWCCAEKKPRLL
jgi:hypothetical protein